MITRNKKLSLLLPLAILFFSDHTNEVKEEILYLMVIFRVNK